MCLSSASALDRLYQNKSKSSQRPQPYKERLSSESRCSAFFKFLFSCTYAVLSKTHRMLFKSLSELFHAHCWFFVKASVWFSFICRVWTCVTIDKHWLALVVASHCNNIPGMSKVEQTWHVMCTLLERLIMHLEKTGDAFSWRQGATPSIGRVAFL